MTNDSMRKANGLKCLTKAVVLFLTVAFATAACSSRDIRPKFDPSIEPFGYESVAYEDNGFKVVSPTSVDTIYNDFTTDTVLVVTPISDLKDRKQIGSDVSPTWHAIEAPCKVLAVIKMSRDTTRHRFWKWGIRSTSLKGCSFIAGKMRKSFWYGMTTILFQCKKDSRISGLVLPVRMRQKESVATIGRSMRPLTSVTER